MENFDFNNLEKYLRDGGDPEAIAKAFADRLNTTIRAIDDEDALKDASIEVAEAWNDYVEVYFGTHKLPAGTILDDWYINEHDVNTIMDTLVKTIPAVDKYMKAFDSFSSVIQPKANDAKDKISNIVDDFFSKYGI